MRGLVSVFALFLSVTPALAHAHLTKASPPENGALATAPEAVVLEFSEAIEPKFSTIEVDDAEGARVDKGDAHGDASDGKRLTVTLKPLVPGAYKVIWHATSTDTHKTSGSYQFKVAP
jgi:methionine-rich copper-binding protein CopC